jgi:hypothetical protein
MAREVWDVRLSTSAGDLVLPAPEMNRVISLLATAYSMAIFAISRLEGSAGCGSSAILGWHPARDVRLGSAAALPTTLPARPVYTRKLPTYRVARLGSLGPFSDSCAAKRDHESPVCINWPPSSGGLFLQASTGVDRQLNQPFSRC